MPAAAGGKDANVDGLDHAISLQHATHTRPLSDLRLAQCLIDLRAFVSEHAPPADGPRVAIDAVGRYSAALTQSCREVILSGSNLVGEVVTEHGNRLCRVGKGRCNRSSKRLLGY